MKLLKSLLLIALSTFALNAFAIDGYKEMKFGMTLEEVKKYSPCKLTKHKNIPDSWACTDLPFMKTKTPMLVTFSEEKLVRVAINVPKNKAETVIEALKDKYKISSENHIEGKESEVRFDNDTIIFRLAIGKSGRDEDYNVFLIYSQEGFAKKQSKKKVEDAKTDL